MTTNPRSSDRSVRFELLFRDNYGAVAAYVARRASPDAVDDVVDEVFLVAWRRLDIVPANPLPWLLTVARNVLGTHIRGWRRSGSTPSLPPDRPTGCERRSRRCIRGIGRS